MTGDKETKSYQYEFEYQWGGVDTPFTKMRRWAKKQNPIVKHLALGFIEWLWQKWVDGRVDMEMASVDKQAKDIVEQWEEEELKQFSPEIKIEPSEVEGLDNISISWRQRD
tara:strand:+ start:1036 stop:1368 length:333 start_codon:yes stop_codon:yes gene_type:complete